MVIPLRAKRLATSPAGFDVGNVLLNLRGHDLFLQACKQRFALGYGQSHTGRRDFLCPLDQPHLMFDRTAWSSLEYQLDCPSHPPRLTHPTTLHTLLRCTLQAWRSHVEFRSAEFPSRLAEQSHHEGRQGIRDLACGSQERSSYFCASVGAVDEDTIRRYIESQKGEDPGESFKITASSEP